MTEQQKDRQHLLEALSKVEDVLDRYGNDKASTEFTLFEARLFILLSESGAACVSCGSEDDVTTREDDYEGTSEPLCAECWHAVDTVASGIYCDQQFAFYNKDNQK